MEPPSPRALPSPSRSAPLAASVAVHIVLAALLVQRTPPQAPDGVLADTPVVVERVGAPLAHLPPGPSVHGVRSPAVHATTRPAAVPVSVAEPHARPRVAPTRTPEPSRSPAPLGTLSLPTVTHAATDPAVWDALGIAAPPMPAAASATPSARRRALDPTPKPGYDTTDPAVASAVELWTIRVQAHLMRAFHPLVTGHDGDLLTRVRVFVDPETGQVQRADLLESSGVADWDAAAMQVARAPSGLPVPPPGADTLLRAGVDLRFVPPR